MQVCALQLMNRGIFKDTWFKEAKKHVATNRIQIMTTSFQSQCSNNEAKAELAGLKYQLYEH